MKTKYLIIIVFLFAVAVTVGGAVAYMLNTQPTQKNATVTEKKADTIKTSKPEEKQPPKLSKVDRDQKITNLSAHMKIHYDEMKDVRYYQAPISNGSGVFLKPYIAYSQKDNKAYLRNYAFYEGDDWIFFDTVYIKIPSNTYILDYARNDSERDNSGGTVWEWYDSPMDAKTLTALRDIAKSSSVKIRFEGKYIEDKALNSDEISYIKNILELYDVLNS